MNQLIIGQWTLLVFLLQSLLVPLTADPDTTATEDPQATKNATLSSSSVVRLSDGNVMPMLGLGVALTGDDTYSAVQSALSVGYRLIDTASEESYGNEDQVGRAIQESSVVKRDNVFVTTKLWDSDHGFFETLESFEVSYEKLNLGTIDLYLMHSPFGGRVVETWDAMLYLQKQGYIKSIGVSNFGVTHLQALKENGRPLPTVNQIEMHPLVYQQRASLLKWCREHNVQIQAYGSLMHGYEEWLMADYPLKDMATRYHKTNAQILLRWALQHDFLIIPKSSKRHRIAENSLFYDFELSQADMDTLDHWGDQIQSLKRNLYKQDWNWNPIDEASVHLGRIDFWPNFEGVDEIYFADEKQEQELRKEEEVGYEL